MKEEKVNKENKILNTLSDLVSIQSFGGIGKEHAIIRYLKNSFKDCHEILEIEDRNGNVHLLVGINHELRNIDNAIILSGHIDTVRESDGHECSISTDGSTIRGLGISDMKSFVATIISNLNYFKSLDIPVLISLTSDEETQLLGIRNIIQKLKDNNINADMIVVGEPTDLDYYVSSRGNSIYVSIMNGVACHSGTPEIGVNAIELQAQFIMEIMNIKTMYSKDSAICITHVDGGKTPSNVVPDMSSMCFGIRTSDSKLLNNIYNYLLDRHCDISKCYGESKLFNVLDIPPFERVSNDFFERQKEITGKNLIDAKYATEAGYFQKFYPEANIIIYGPGNQECIHKAGEFINYNNISQYDIELREMLDNYLVYKNNKVKKLTFDKK